MEQWKEYTARTVDEALTEALIQLQTTSDNVEYEIMEKESSGILGLFSKPAKIRVKIKEKEIESSSVEQFLHDLLKAMNMDENVEIEIEEKDNTVDINISGKDMGILIGKRGQTLDALQYLVSLVANKNSKSYVKVKLDTENYRQRRKETLENLARNIANKVKKTRRSVVLEPMNPYERRIIHSVLQSEKSIETHSEGEEPYRKVVVTLRKGYVDNKYKKEQNNRYIKDYKEYKKSKERSEENEK